MRYAGMINNDVVNGDDVCVSVWVQGCPHRCNGCHNPEAWDFDGGILIGKNALIQKTIEAIGKNGIRRNLSILGGEPLCEENKAFTLELIAEVRKVHPEILVLVWTGYTIEELSVDDLKGIDVLIDGRYVEEERDVSLPLRGSTNQRIIYEPEEYRRWLEDD